VALSTILSADRRARCRAFRDQVAMAFGGSAKGLDGATNVGSCMLVVAGAAFVVRKNGHPTVDRMAISPWTKQRVDAREDAAPAVSLRTVSRGRRSGARPSTEVRDAATKGKSGMVPATGRASVA